MKVWFDIALKLAALVATPVYAWLQSHDMVAGIVGFLAALLALFLSPPQLKGK